MIARSAIRPEVSAAPLRGDCTGNPRLGEKMPPAASLSPLRTWYNQNIIAVEQTPARHFLLRDNEL